MDSSEIFIQSDTSTRVVQSAYSFLQALYPNGNDVSTSKLQYRYPPLKNITNL